MEHIPKKKHNSHLAPSLSMYIVEGKRLRNGGKGGMEAKKKVAQDSILTSTSKAEDG
jgi:hypothetical protein